ncbi:MULTISPECIES: HNH endonuclease [Rahnella]|uniref:HNH endonuclease n=1 Tax=Rahnella laticis TaxID=2787622 RepID=A0ABS0E314_9GAMM|nr:MULTISPECIES: HNH endonuclease [Rahnella]MBF7979465.1 HNH endonuclease [Rahnella laticis]MBF7999270.1 HNH endonuclease [Rahnella sp. LAC-M12]
MANEEICVVLAENDDSKWDDKTGERYHFPKMYRKHLSPGMRFVYYKGKLKPENKEFASQRLSKLPHYFGVGRISDITPDDDGHFYATLTDFQEFDNAVIAKKDDGYYEDIPERQKSNYWRPSVRPISAEIFADIAVAAALTEPRQIIGDIKNEDVHIEDETDEESLISYQEGKKSSKFVTTYERDQKLKKRAKELHGTTCFACGFNFGDFYGEYAKDFIHIHHVVPVSEFGGSKNVDPKKDLVPVCANCHGIIHRKKDRTLSIDELKAMIAASKKTP